MIKVVEAAATRVLRSRFPTSGGSCRIGRRKAMYRWRRDQYDNHRRYGEVKHRHRHDAVVLNVSAVFKLQI